MKKKNRQENRKENRFNAVAVTTLLGLQLSNGIFTSDVCLLSDTRFGKITKESVHKLNRLSHQ